MTPSTSDVWSIAWLSVQVSTSAVFLAALAGIPLGTFLGLSQFRGKQLVVSLIYTGMALPPVVVGLLVYLGLSRSGPLAALGWLFSAKAMILAQFILAMPFIVGITMTAISAVPQSLRLQIRSLGASRWQLHSTILKEARAGVVLAVAIAFGRSISEVGAVLMVGGNIAGHTRVLTTAVVLETSQGHFETALALGGVLLLIALVVNGLILSLKGQQR